jgi:hypothetical protein
MKENEDEDEDDDNDDCIGAVTIADEGDFHL